MRTTPLMILLAAQCGFLTLGSSARAADRPNIDRIAKEGALFTDQYAQPSCTPGRASFITGMYPPTQKGTSLSIDTMIDPMMNSYPSAN